MKILSAIFFLGIVVLGCSNSSNPDNDNLFNSLTGLDVKASLALANEWKYTAPDISSYINSDELVIEFPDGRKVAKPITGDSMLVAFAPYINNTHSCSIHYPSSCQGELTNNVMAVTVSYDSGEIILSSNVTTQKNGFFELWLPRDKTLRVKVVYQSKTSEEVIRTFKGNNTCITTMRLI